MQCRRGKGGEVSEAVKQKTMVKTEAMYEHLNFTWV